MTMSVRPLARGIEAAIKQNLPQKLQGRLRDFFMLTADFLPLAASAAGTSVSIQIQSDSDFVLGAAVGVCTTTDNSTRLTFVPQTVLLLSTGTGRQLFTDATHWHNVYGTAEEPAIWPIPKLLPANSTFTVRHANLEATARNVRVAFYGFKVFFMEDDA